MTNEPTVLDTLDPEIVDRLASRRDLFRRSAVALGGLATVPTMLAAVSTQAFGQGEGLPEEIVDVLNFALTLEYLEDEFYQAGLAQRGLIPGRFRTVFQTIGKHESEHVRFLQGALGPRAIAKPAFDLTAKGAYADVLSNFATFSAVSATLEDTGVAAYKGQAPKLQGTPLLEPALRIHSVEARHAAEVHKLRGELPWKGPFDEPMSKDAVLAAAGPFLA